MRVVCIGAQEFVFIELPEKIVDVGLVFKGFEKYVIHDVNLQWNIEVSWRGYTLHACEV